MHIIHHKLSVLIFSHTLTQIKFMLVHIAHDCIPTDSQPLSNTLMNSITHRSISSPSFTQMSTLILVCFYAQTCSYICSNLDTLKSNPRTLIRSNQIRSVTQSCPTLCDPMNRSTPGLHVHHQLPEFTQTHVHRVSDAIHPSHPLSSPSPPAPNPFQHQSLFQ